MNATFAAAHAAVPMTEWLIVFTNLLLTIVTLALVAQGFHDTNAIVKVVAAFTGRKGKGYGKHEAGHKRED